MPKRSVSGAENHLLTALDKRMVGVYLIINN